MFLSGMPEYYILYCIVSLSCLLFIRKRWELNKRDTVIILVAILSFGIIVPLSLKIIGLAWSLLLLGLSALSVLLANLLVRMREDRELEEQIEQVIKPSGTILPMPSDEAEPNRETGQSLFEVAASEAEAAAVSSSMPESIAMETFSKTATSTKAAPPSPPADPEKVQRHYGTATEALRRRDYFTAYRELQQALSCHPPLAAKWMMTRDLVHILKEMGLYRESVAVLEQLLSELPVAAEKKQTELKRQISYLQILSKVLEAESRRNLSWSLIPVHIRSRAEREYRELIKTTV